ncbi:MAG: hypothetical protein C0501_23785 [Isosphaera sp.]|nr:hypothetical protein [Isosphaera sp.]
MESDTPPAEVAAYFNDEFDLDDLALHEIEAGLRYMFWVFRCVKWTTPERPNPLDDPAALATRLAKATGEFVHEIIDDNRPDDGTPDPDAGKSLSELFAAALARRRAEGKSDPD